MTSWRLRADLASAALAMASPRLIAVVDFHSAGTIRYRTSLAGSRHDDRDRNVISPTVQSRKEAGHHAYRVTTPHSSADRMMLGIGRAEWFMRRHRATPERLISGLAALWPSRKMALS